MPGNPYASAKIDGFKWESDDGREFTFGQNKVENTIRPGLQGTSISKSFSSTTFGGSSSSSPAANFSKNFFGAGNKRDTGNMFGGAIENSNDFDVVNNILESFGLTGLGATSPTSFFSSKKNGNNFGSSSWEKSIFDDSFFDNFFKSDW